MKRWLRIAAGAALLLFLGADAFISPTAHDVHSPGGIPAKVTFFESSQNAAWDWTRPSQSLADMKCRVPNDRTMCDASVLATYFPNLTQTPQTLYLVWSHCSDSAGVGEVTLWDGYNFEYVPSTRELDIHCYRAKPWLYPHEYLYGVQGTGRWALVAVSTVGIGSGTITIVEDDHLEHLFGDQSSEYQIATATIS